MSSENRPAGRKPQQGGRQPVALRMQVQSNRRQSHIPIASNTSTTGSEPTGDQGILATKKSIANRRWEGEDDISAGSHENVGTTTNNMGALAQKLNIAYRKWEDGSVSHHDSSSSPLSQVRAVDSDRDAGVGVLESKLAIACKEGHEQLQHAQPEQRRDTTTHRQGTATEQQGQHADNTGSVDNSGTNETPEQQREEQQQEVAFDAYLVDEEEQAEYRRQRERELRQEMERRAFNELVRTLPHAEEVDQEELRQQHQQEQRAAALRRRKHLKHKVAAVAPVAVVIIAIVCVVAVTLSKDCCTKEETSREDEIAWILEKASGDAIYNKSSPRHDAFRWLVDDDAMQLSVGDAGVKDFTILERYVIVLFFLVTGGLSNWTNTLGFLGNRSVCDWRDPTVLKGIGCHDSGSVRVIQVHENNLYGTLPDELSAIEELEEIYIVGNRLYGTIPNSLQKNAKLERISLQLNLLSGTVPDLRNLQILEIHSNFLTGTLPGWVTSSSELYSLSVFNNFLSGTIPRFASQDGLEYVDLSFNLFEGSIPPSLGSLSVLEELWLEYNRLSGSIPTLIGQATKLQVLLPASNSLTGTIPTELGKLQDLQHLSLHYNSLTGPIPSELGHLTGLVAVSLCINQLTGTIPSELAGLEELKYLYLHNNTLTGNVAGLCFNQGDGHNKKTGFEQLIDFYADCKDNTLEPEEVVCPCCTHCCNDRTGDCSRVKTQEERCQEKALQWEGSTDDDKVTECECSEGGQVISCKDPSCMYCNDADGTLCYVDGQSGMELGIDNTTFFAVSMQYVRGRDEHVALQYHGIDGIGYCSAAINGRDCAACWRVSCTGDGYKTFEVDCSNLGYDGVLSACKARNDPFYMLWDVANALLHDRDFPVRHDCVPYNTAAVG